jgi:hypothetical protein
VLQPKTTYFVRELGKNRKPTYRMSWKVSGAKVITQNIHWLHAGDVVKFETGKGPGKVTISVEGKENSGDDFVDDPTIWAVTYRGTVAP